MSTVESTNARSSRKSVNIGGVGCPGCSRKMEVAMESDKSLKMSDVFLSQKKARATYGRWYGAITTAQQTDIKEYFRLMGLNNVETIREFGPEAQ